MTDLSDAECTDPERTTKRAVVLIHGMGDQSPMATLRGFVDAVWTSDEEVAGKNAKSWTVPDAILESREVRRITTPPDRDCVRTEPVAPVFGPGAKDVPISSGAGRKWIAHTRYWDPPMKGKDGSSHLELLRQAVNLRDRGSSDAA